MADALIAAKADPAVRAVLIAGQPGVFTSHETVELVFDPLALPDFSNLWDKLEPRMQTSVTYVARMVLIDSDIEQPEGPLGPPRGFDESRASQ